VGWAEGVRCGEGHVCWLICERKAKGWRMGVHKLQELETPAQELHRVKSTGCVSKEKERRDQGIKKIHSDTIQVYVKTPNTPN